MADSPFLLCRWGNIRLFCSQVNTDGGRTQVVHEPASGDRHIVQDRGLRVRRVRCRLQFDSFPGSPEPVTAALALEDAKNSGVVQMFTHPFLGRYLASVGDFTSEVEASGIITGEAEFIAESDDIAVSPIPAPSFGDSVVTNAAEAMDAELSTIGALKTSGATAQALVATVPDGTSQLDSGLPTNLSLAFSVNLNVQLSVSISANVSASASASAAASANATATAAVTATASGSITASADLSVALAAAASAEVALGLFGAVSIDARVAVASWSSGDVPTRQIQIDTSRILDNLATLIDVGELEGNVTLWQAHRAVILLGDAVQAAAISATSEAPSVFVMRLQDRTALLPLVARIYGGAGAQDRERQIMALNDIATPGWLPPGDYLMPQRPRGPQAA